MTKKFLPFICSFIAGFLFFFPDSHLFAETSLIGQQLVTEGKAFYEQQDYAKAIDALSKALLVDPQNKEAVEYLNKMGLADGLYGRPNSPLSQVADMAEDLNGYVNSLEQENSAQEELNQKLQEDKQNMEQAVIAKEKEKEELAKKAKEIEEASQARVKQAEKAMTESEKKNQERGKEIVRLHTDLFSLKGRLSEQLSYSKEQKDSLQELRRKFGQHQKDSASLDREARIKHDDQMLDKEKELNQVKHKFAETALEQKRRIGNLEDALNQQITEAAYAQDRLVFAEYRLVNSESLLAEKNKKIQELLSSLTQMENGLAFLESKGKAQTEAQNKDATLQEEVAERVQFLKKQDQLIGLLKEKLIAAQMQITSLKESEKAVNSETDLKNKLTEVNAELTKTKSLYDEQKDSYAVLEKRLQDVQARLGVMEKLMQAKQEQVKEMEKQLSEGLPVSEGKIP